MKRGFAAMVLLALLAPAAALVASVGSMPGCCAGGDDRITAAMACCETTICASPTPARQPKAVDAPVTTVVLTELEALSIAIPYREPETPHGVAFSPPVRIRLALIATLLI